MASRMKMKRRITSSDSTHAHHLESQHSCEHLNSVEELTTFRAFERCKFLFSVITLDRYFRKYDALSRCWLDSGRPQVLLWKFIGGVCMGKSKPWK